MSESREELVEAPSPQRYAWRGKELRAIVPSRQPPTAPLVYTRRILPAGFVEAHAVRLPAGSSKPESCRQEGLVVLVVQGGMETRIAGMPAHDCGVMSLTYHPTGEWGTGTVGPGGITMFVLSVESAQAQAWESDGVSRTSWTELTSTDLAIRALNEFAVADDLSALGLQELTTLLFASNPERHGSSRTPSWWNRLEARLKDSPAGPLRLKDLAADVGIHPVHLCATYHRLQGQTLGDVLRRRRMEAACRHILSTEWTMGEIALELGYSDQAHFTRAFTKTFGFGPSRLRGLGEACQRDRSAPRNP